MADPLNLFSPVPMSKWQPFLDCLTRLPIVGNDYKNDRPRLEARLDSNTICRLQLKQGLFWYGHHPKILEMVSDRSSGAETWKDLRKISMRVLFDSNKCKQIQLWVDKNSNMSLFVKNKSLRSYTGHTKIGKNN